MTAHCRHNKNLFTLPDQKTLFDWLAIEEKHSFPFVFGDNIDGYYQGHTMTNSDGHYQHAKGHYFENFTSVVNGNRQNREQALNGKMSPDGISHLYSSGFSESLSLLSGQRCIAIRLRAPQKEKLAILPAIRHMIDDSPLEISERGILTKLEQTVSGDDPCFLSIVSNRNIQCLTEQEPDTFATEGKTVNTKLSIESENAEDDITFYLIFSHDKPFLAGQIEEFAVNNALQQHSENIYQFLTCNFLWTNDTEYNRALMWARLASQTFVTHEYGTGIWAGLPWFKDCWGRDTFIALSGTSLINNKLEDAKAIISNFAVMQMKDKTSKNYGRIPNRVTSKTDFIYNTTDGTPWMIKAIWQYLNTSGDIEFVDTIYPVVQRYIEGVEKYYQDHTELMCHRDPDTWMDAKIEGKIPWSPRGDRANDIQALWFTSLISAAEIAKLAGDFNTAALWLKKARRVKKQFLALFWQKETQSLADHIDRHGVASTQVRPNQLMTLTIPDKFKLIPDRLGAKIVKNSVEQLLFPWGICSLSQNDPYFHPYHDNQQAYHKDAAYHNGTVWGWNAGFTVTALSRFGQQSMAYQLSKNLAHQILHQGHRGTMSENLDAWQHKPQNLVETGTYAQAWSVSEFARNAQQDYLGFRPELLRDRLVLSPKIPSEWSQFSAQVPFAKGDSLQISYQKDGHIETFQLDLDSKLKLKLLFTIQDEKGDLWQTTLNAATTKQLVFNRQSASLLVNQQPCNSLAKVESDQVISGELNFAQPDFTLNHASVKQHDYLQNILLTSSTQVAKDTEE